MSNGVPSRRTSPPEPSHAHEHEWVLCGEHDPSAIPADQPRTEGDEPPVVVTYEYCDYVEQRAAGTSERLDETFYETMYECGATRTTHFVANDVVYVSGGFEFEVGTDHARWHEAAQRAADRLTGNPDTTDVEEPEIFEHWSWGDGVEAPSLTVTLDGDEHHVTFERVSTNVEP